MILQAGFVFDIEGGIKEEKGKHVICLKNEKWQKKQCNYYHVYLFDKYFYRQITEYMSYIIDRKRIMRCSVMGQH